MASNPDCSVFILDLVDRTICTGSQSPAILEVSTGGKTRIPFRRCRSVNDRTDEDDLCFVNFEDAPYKTSERTMFDELATDVLYDAGMNSASNYQSVSGYLVAELPNNGVLSALYKVASKKLWFVLDDRNCTLLGFEGPDKANKTPSSTVELRDASITIEASSDNVFTLNSANKEYKFKANNHEAMMVWVQAIQALRGLRNKLSCHSKNLRIPDFGHRITRSQSLAVGLRSDAVRRPTQLPAGESIAECDEAEDLSKTRSRENLPTARMSTSSELLSSGDRSVNFAIADIAIRSGSQASRPSALSLSASDSFATGAFAMSLRRGSSSPTNKSTTPRLSEQSESNADSPDSASEASIDYDAMVEGLSVPIKKRSESGNGVSDSEGLGAAETDSANNDTSRTNSSTEEMYSKIRALVEKLEQRDTVIQSLNTQLEKREKDLTEMDERIHILEMQLKQCQDANCRVNKPAPRRFTLFGGSSSNSESDARQPASASEEQLIESCKILTNKNQFLNAEIKRLETIYEEHRTRVKEADEKVAELNSDVAKAKLEHLKTLQCALLCLVLNPRSCSVRDSEAPLDGVKTMYKAVEAAVSELLDMSRVRNPALPTLDVLTTPNKFYVDKYGFKHTFCVEDTTASENGVDSRSNTLETYQTVMNRLEMLVFVASQLYLNYHDVIAAQSHIATDEDLGDSYWKKLFLEVNPSTLHQALRQHVKENAIPLRFRSELWRTLIRNSPPVHQKLKKLGPSFYSLLAKQAQEDQQIYSNKYARQIAVDLLRTMPSNVHYENINADKIKMLSEVLLTFLRYNSTIGYYQGMNFIAANALLFLDKEDSFWLMVALTEHFFHREQFFPDLIGLQADQLVLKELIEAKLPRLHAHLKQLELDIEVISFTWFATLFFNSLRFETLLRIWDCFLLDGRKFLFRASLALLKLQEDLLLEQTDALSAWRCLKVANQTVVAAEQLIESAYNDFRPFPKRKVLDQKQTAFIEQLRQTLNIKISEKQQFIQMEAELRKMESGGAFARNRDIYYRACPVSRSQTVWLSYGDSTASRLALVELETRSILELDGDFDSEVTAMCTVDARSSSIVLVGFANGRLCAFDHASKQRLWYVRIRDAILSCIVVYCDRLLSSSLPAVARVFCGTADGSLAVMELFRFSCEPSVFYLNLCQSPVTALLHLPQFDILLCASQDKLHTAGASSLDRRRMYDLQVRPVDGELLGASGNRVSYHSKHIAIMQTVRDVGVCIVRKYSSALEFYAVSQPRMKAGSIPPTGHSGSRKCELVFQPLFVYDICHDGMNTASRHASGEANLRALHYRISTVLALDDILWVGSSCGETFVYETVLDKNPTEGSYDDGSTLILRMKNKLSELPVTEFQALYDLKRKQNAEENAETVKSVNVISLSGCYGDDESILLWQKADEKVSTIWTNKTFDFSKRKPLFPPSARVMSKLKHDMSELTLSAMHQTLARDANRSAEVEDSPRMKADWRRKSLY